MKKLTILLVLLLTFVLVFSKDTKAYTLDTPLVYNSWINTDIQTVVISGVNYYELTADANPLQSQRYVLFYQLNDVVAIDNVNFPNINYLSVNGGSTKLPVNYLSVGDMNIYETYDINVNVYIVKGSLTDIQATEIMMNFLTRYFSFYRGSMYDFFTETDLFTGSYQEGYDKGFEDGEREGYTNGKNDLYNNGSVYYGLDPLESVDYLAGLVAGRNQIVNAGMNNFLNDFKIWFPSVIVIVLILAIVIAVKKDNRNEM